MTKDNLMRLWIVRYIFYLAASEKYDDEEGVWRFRNGDECGRCVSAAILIAQKFRGTVYGYYSRNNPSALIGGERIEGHDFAIIHSRWIADYWAFRVARMIKQPIFDLNISTERQLVVQYYGNLNNWDHVMNFDE